MRLEKKIALVTGASRGIGKATAELFAEHGATVYAADLDIAEDAPSGVTPLLLDVTSPAAWQTAVDDIVAEAGRIDVLVNNAGIVRYYDGIADMSPEHWHEVIAVNQTGPYLGMRAVIPVMKRLGGGSIVNVSSIWGIAGAAGVAAYTASKFAVRGMTKNAALTYVGDGIRVNSLHPGIIATPLIDAQDADITSDIVDVTPMKRLGRPREIAYGALFLASDESSYMTGAELVIDGGYTTP
ncbi:MAG: SDR family oxidoreductase [Mycolicibacterium neoaurum]|uniref:SDR family NAD(P)-dependent oxidoreductase n=1 Tax=Mycolicibacterium neoaurum TaxID=1795 RepID=UPI002FF8C34F